MDLSKARFVAVAASVICLGIASAIFLWVNLAPRLNYADNQTRPLEGLNRLGAVPEFALAERSGRSVTLADLRGTIWIADFIYTSCQDTCPLQTAEMAKLQELWSDKPDLRLVSFSVDPAKDTPAVLSRYADRFKADKTRWLFLTGEKEKITRLVQEGFRLSAVPASGGTESGIILHSPRFVLVDKQAQIRGYYDSRDAEALARLKTDAAKLSNGKKE